jgi:hypothetical protein
MQLMMNIIPNVKKKKPYSAFTVVLKKYDLKTTLFMQKTAGSRTLKYFLLREVCNAGCHHKQAWSSTFRFLRLQGQKFTILHLPIPGNSNM